MKLRTITLTIVISLTAATAWGTDETMKRAQGLFKPIPVKVPSQKNNPSSPAKFDLGKKLYLNAPYRKYLVKAFEPALAPHTLPALRNHTWIPGAVFND